MVSIILCGFEPSKMRYVETPNYVLISESRPAERTEGRNTHPLSARTLTDVHVARCAECIGKLGY